MTDLGAVRPFTTSARPGHHGLAERIRAGNRSVSPWHRPAGRRVRCAQMTDLGAVRPFTTSARPGHHGLAERIRPSRDRIAIWSQLRSGRVSRLMKSAFVLITTFSANKYYCFFTTY